MNPEIDNYIADGCGRCPLGGTPQCKVNDWRQELQYLRGIILDCGLTEELKWSVPCYTFQNSNIAILSAFKAYCSLSFFKGALLKDQHRILVKPGENSQAARLFKFTAVEEIKAQENIIREYLFEAVEVEKAGLKVPFKKTPEPIPEELQKKLEEIPALKTAFEALTPGRQRGYILYISGAKQSKTRAARVDKYIPKILAGKGFHDRD